MSAQLYIVNRTLFTYHLIQLDQYKVFPYPKEWRENGTIEIRLQDNQNGKAERKYSDCGIDPKHRLSLPVEAAVWIKNCFPFSEAYFLGNPKGKQLTQKQGAEALTALKDKGKQLHVPVEALWLSWETGGETPYLMIAPAFQITEENALKYLTREALASVLPYIFSGVRNTSCPVPQKGEGKCYIIDQTTDWLPAEEYEKTPFSHPGIYLLRRRTDGEHKYAYYVGKAADIKARITTDKKAVCHPTEKGEANKRYDDVACISLKFDSLRELFSSLSSADATPSNNPGVTRGSSTDRALYAVEDVIIHALTMLLKSEGMRLDNKQYRGYTTEQLEP